jgi:hypothetical protein
MKKSTFCIIVVSLIFVSHSCSPNNGKEVKDLRVIDVAGSVGNSRFVNLSEIADTIEYIPLETIKESLVERLLDDKIFYENGALYLSQRNGTIKIFDKHGSYINSINRKGRGLRSMNNLQL